MKKLSKQLGLLDVFAIAVGTMVSSGLFVLPGLAASKAGPAVVIAYVLSGFLVIPSLLSKAELATAMPRAGGTYFFISRSLGSLFGTIDGVGVWLALTLKSSIALVGLGAYMAAYVGLPMKAIALLCAVVFMVTNIVGAKETSRVQIGMVALLLGILTFLLAKGLPAVETARLTPVFPFGTKALLPTTAFVFVSYIGLTKVASISEEIKNPERNIPLGMLLSLVVVILMYALVITVVIGVVPQEVLYNTLIPIHEVGKRVMGPTGALFISIAAVMAFATTANAGIMSGSRYLLAMSRDHVVPHPLSRLSRFRTPKNAILLTSGAIALIVLTTGLEQIAKLASTFQLLVFAFVNIAVIVMRESGIKSYDPGFKSPLYPYMQIAGILVSVVLIPEMGLMSSIFAMGLIGLGIVWHNLYVRRRVVRVGAFAKMAERVAERLLEKDANMMGLGSELRQILKEKGLRVDDPFSQTVGKADFLDVDKRATAEDVIRQGAELIAERGGASKDLLLGAMLQRNQLGETPAGAGIALPHLLLDEVDEFRLVALRSIRGIDFPMADQPIHAIFLLLGDKKNPTQHLRFLAEIARRAESPGFIDRWVNADSTETLREVLIDQPAGWQAEDGGVDL